MYPVKRHRGEPGHTRDTHGTRGLTRAHGTHRQTPQPSKPNDTPARPRDGRNRGRLKSAGQARSRPHPAADSEEAAPGEPDPASTRSQSASPRLLEGGRRNEGARGRCVTAGGAARASDELETREAEAGMRNGRGEADLRAQRRDHEGPRIEHGAGAKRAPLTLG